MNIFLSNFGCKSNRYDAAAMLTPLFRQGHELVNDPCAAGVLVVNTCTVTSRSDAKARAAVRNLHRRNPEAGIIVTGCSVHTSRKELSALPGVYAVLDNSERFRLHAVLTENGLLRAGAGGGGDSDGPSGEAGFDHWRDGIDRFPGRSRAYLKIQDGCDGACSYCIVPRVRGRSRSRDPGALVREARRLNGQGHREIVLTGIHIGHYGRDRTDGITLRDLIEHLLAETEITSIRLGSLNPDEISVDFLRYLRGEERIARHLHIPLQSGSDRVLGSMARTYRSKDFERVVEEATGLMPTLNIGSDVIVGFPTEGNREFRESCDLIERLPVGYLHVFRYSDRPGTRASAMAGRATDPEVTERCRIMKEAGSRKRSEFRGRMLDRLLTAVHERTFENEPVPHVYRSSNYLKLYSDRAPEPPGNGRFRTVSVFRDGLLGYPVPEGAAAGP